MSMIRKGRSGERVQTVSQTFERASRHEQLPKRGASAPARSSLVTRTPVALHLGGVLTGTSTLERDGLLGFINRTSILCVVPNGTEAGCSPCTSRTPSLPAAGPPFFHSPSAHLARDGCKHFSALALQRLGVRSYAAGAGVPADCVGSETLGPLHGHPARRAARYTMAPQLLADANAAVRTGATSGTASHLHRRKPGVDAGAGGGVVGAVGACAALPGCTAAGGRPAIAGHVPGSAVAILAFSAGGRAGAVSGAGYGLFHRSQHFPPHRPPAAIRAGAPAGGHRVGFVSVHAGGGRVVRHPPRIRRGRADAVEARRRRGRARAVQRLQSGHVQPGHSRAAADGHRQADPRGASSVAAGRHAGHDGLRPAQRRFPLLTSAGTGHLPQHRAVFCGVREGGRGARVAGYRFRAVSDGEQHDAAPHLDREKDPVTENRTDAH
eukprot:ctg_1777.g295